MKKILLVITISFFTNLFNAQEQSQATEKSNDFVVNPIALVLGAANLEYERVISENSGIGVTTSFILDDYVLQGANGYNIAPYYNYYFGKKRASGFYLGGYVSINSGEVEKPITYYYQSGSYTTYTTAKETDFGVGFKFGGKWVVKNNIVLEVGTGLGRNFGGERKINSTGMLGIGKRF